MGCLFIEYPKCSTCKKAKKWLVDNKIEFEDRNIVEDNPTRDEISKWCELGKLDMKKFFNTSGLKYKELNLKDKLINMSFDEKLDLLASDGMLVKRPILIKNDIVLVGFKEDEWNKLK